jgi:hypothetical protein
MDTQKSIFGGGQPDLDKFSEILSQYTKATTKLGDVKTVQDIIPITSALSKIIQTTTKLNTGSQIVKSK